MREVKGLGATPLIFRGYSTYPFAPVYFERNHLILGCFGPTLFLSIGRPHFLHRFASSRRNLCDSATCRPVPPRNLRPGFEAKPVKPSPGGFEAQSTKPS